MRGTGEGFRPFDLAPGSSMTNGALAARVEGVAGPKLTVTYKGGQQTIIVDPKTPIVGFEPGAQTDLRPGAAIVARGAMQTTAQSTPGLFSSERTGSCRCCDTRGDARWASLSADRHDVRLSLNRLWARLLLRRELAAAKLLSRRQFRQFLGRALRRAQA
jgi:hypothetical protein